MKNYAAACDKSEKISSSSKSADQSSIIIRSPAGYGEGTGHCDCRSIAVSTFDENLSSSRTFYSLVSLDITDHIPRVMST